MNPRHLKFHLIAIGVICAVVIGLYFLFGPRHAGPAAELIGDRFIQIDSATWGRNCDLQVDQAAGEWLPPRPGEKGTPKPTRAAHNNALEAIRAQCEGKLTCRMSINSATLRTDPLPNCYKRLQLGYRCFSYDRLWTLDLGQGDLLELNCRESQQSTSGM